MQIEFYLLWLSGQPAVRSGVNGRFHVFNSFLFTILADRRTYPRFEDAYAHVRRWTKGVNLFAMDWLVVPINDPERHHWSLAIVAHPARQVDPERWQRAKETRAQSAKTDRRRSVGSVRLRAGRGMEVGAGAAQMRMAADGSLQPPSTNASSAPPGRLPKLYRIQQRSPPPPTARPPPTASPGFGLRSGARVLRSSSSSTSHGLTGGGRGGYSSTVERETARRMQESQDKIRAEEDSDDAASPTPQPQLYGKRRQPAQVQSGDGPSRRMFDDLHLRGRAAQRREDDVRFAEAGVDEEGDVDDAFDRPRSTAPGHGRAVRASPPPAHAGDAGSSALRVAAASPPLREDDNDNPACLLGGEPAEAGRFPAILHFDSLPFPLPQAGRIAGVLRKYLQCEWDHQRQLHAAASADSAESSAAPPPHGVPASDDPSVASFVVPPWQPRTFDARTFPHAEVDVPKQPNDFDCGPFILEYAHRFCLAPFRDTRQGAVHRPHWFEAADVMKRDEIDSLLHELHRRQQQQQQQQERRTAADAPAHAPASTQCPQRPRAAQAEVIGGLDNAKDGRAAAPAPSVRSPSPTSSSSTTGADSSSAFHGSIADSDAEDAEDDHEAGNGDGHERSARRSLPRPPQRSGSIGFVPSSLGPDEVSWSPMDWEVD